MKKQILTFCASVLMAFSGICLRGPEVSADADYDVAAKNALTYAERASGHYYYDWFAEFDRADGYRRYYAYLDDFSKRLVSYSGDFTRGEYFVELNADSPVSWAPDLSGLSNDDQLCIMHMFLLDHPYYAFLFPAFTIDETLKLPFAFDFDTAAGRKQIFAKINAYIDSYSGATSVSGTYDRAKYIHDALCVNNTYTYDSSNHPSAGGWPNNIYGPVYYNTSVCEGYALTFHMLAQYYGLESACVSGSSRNEAHMWDILKMDDGLFYYVDVTWDDALDPPGTWTKDFRDDYFVKGSEFFDRDHNRDTQESFVHQPIGDAAESRILPLLAKNAYGETQNPVTIATSTAASTTAAVSTTSSESTASVQSISETATSESKMTEIASSVNTTSAQTSVSTLSALKTGSAQSAASGSSSASIASETTAAESGTTAVNSTDSAQSESKLWIVVLAVIGGSVLLGAGVMLFRKKSK